MIKTLFAVSLAFSVVASTGLVAAAADIKFLCPIAMRVVMADLIPRFERTAPHKVTVDYATVGVIRDRVLKGDAADVAIVSVQQADELSKQGTIVAGSRADIGRVGYGVFVRQGAPKPDIGSVDALKRSVLAAKSIAYGDPAGGGPTGIYVAGLMDRLGIGAEVKSKTKVFPSGGDVLGAVAKGDADFGFSVMSDTAAVSGVDLVGPLPADIQRYTEYVGGILATTKQPEAAKALISYIASPAGQSVLKAKGFEPR